MRQERSAQEREAIPGHLHDADCTHNPCRCRFGPPRCEQCGQDDRTYSRTFADVGERHECRRCGREWWVMLRHPRSCRCDSCRSDEAFEHASQQW